MAGITALLATTASAELWIPFVSSGSGKTAPVHQPHVARERAELLVATREQSRSTSTSSGVRRIRRGRSRGRSRAAAAAAAARGRRGRDGGRLRHREGGDPAARLRGCRAVVVQRRAPTERRRERDQDGTTTIDAPGPRRRPPPRGRCSTPGASAARESAARATRPRPRPAARKASAIPSTATATSIRSPENPPSPPRRAAPLRARHRRGGAVHRRTQRLRGRRRHGSPPVKDAGQLGRGGRGDAFGRVAMPKR